VALGKKQCPRCGKPLNYHGPWVGKGLRGESQDFPAGWTHSYFAREVFNGQKVCDYSEQASQGHRGEEQEDDKTTRPSP